jgi:hypothetical protein
VNQHAHQDPTAILAAADLLDDAITAVSEQLTTISNLVPLISALTDSRQRGLGFVTYEGKQIQDEMIRKDREERDRLIKYARRRGRLPLDGLISGRGESPAPGNIVAISVEAHVHTTLHHVIRQFIKDQANNGVCALTRAPENASLHQLIVATRSLAWACTSTTLLDAIDRDLEQLVDDAHRLIDGNDRTVLAANCPHCGNRTLVVYFADDLIRCDRHPKTGRYEPCTCPDPLCECKSRPRAFRHEWHRTKGTKPNGWWALADRLNLERNTR